uniref:WD repeat-containing protein 55 homolog n=1 Tax=Megaselia scalaris TaxID=36166 RepID=T1GXD6_MEGSC
SGVRAPRNAGSDEEEYEPNINNIKEEEEDDETVKAIIQAIKKPRTVPKDIELDEFITDITFHPTEDILAAGLINGDIQLIKYSNEENEIYKTMEVHTKACRDIEFSDCGKYIISGSKDLSIMVTDIETEKLKKFYDGAHTDSVNKIFVLDENVFFSGDDSGHLKMWDMRTNEAIFSLHEVEDQITAIATNEAQKVLIFTSSDGYLTSVNIGAR